ncbi:hypothetical protein Ddye_019784 [Dipteronia dyeriana]|uniref:Reverse transcriptase domain-containing protein n=1 Tax=Dipteronia dyeriana TaxID=168575 RepID=A0AAD9TYF4_9ROSI|nr:hypothetical protein Ddye_019784 [Dipteronia dyeriana]
MIKGVVLGLEEEHISHLQFADDTLVFLQPKEQYLQNARRILRCYELVSGLRLNFHKMSIVDVGKVCDQSRDWVGIFRCVRAALPISYLGLTLGGHPGSKIFWSDLVRLVERRLAPWKKIFLNKGGRLVLIKSVLTNLPTYFMSVFTMPISITQTIERLKRDFFLGYGIQKRKIHSIKWVTLCQSKKEGGLGVCSVLNLHKGLLAKWVWRFGVESSPLWKRAICAKYGIQKDILRWDWACGANSSVFTKSIAKFLKNGSISAQILKEEVRVLVGKEDRASLWSDIMVEGSSLKEVFPRIYALAMDKLGCISNYGHREGSEWE